MKCFFGIITLIVFALTIFCYETQNAAFIFCISFLVVSAFNFGAAVQSESHKRREELLNELLKR